MLISVADKTSERDILSTYMESWNIYSLNLHHQIWIFHSKKIKSTYSLCLKKKKLKIYRLIINLKKKLLLLVTPQNDIKQRRNPISCNIQEKVELKMKRKKKKTSSEIPGAATLQLVNMSIHLLKISILMISAPNFFF